MNVFSCRPMNSVETVEIRAQSMHVPLVGCDTWKAELQVHFTRSDGSGKREAQSRKSRQALCRARLLVSPMPHLSVPASVACTDHDIRWISVARVCGRDLLVVLVEWAPGLRMHSNQPMKHLWACPMHASPKSSPPLLHSDNSVTSSPQSHRR